MSHSESYESLSHSEQSSFRRTTFSGILLPSLLTYRLANQMPELNMLVQLLGEAHKSKPLPFLQASFTIPLALTETKQNQNNN